MQRLLIVGCGDVAQRMLPWLTRHYRVFCLVREPSAAAALRATGARLVPGDLDNPATLRRAARIAELVLHFAPPPVSGALDTRTRNLLAAFATAESLPRSLVYVSTTGVYGDCAGDMISETRPVRPQTDRARRRVDAESRLRAFGRRNRVCIPILRVPGIYAADRLPLDRLRRGDPALLAAEDSHTNHIHADDLGRLAWQALRQGRCNRAYNAVDDSNLKMGAYFDLVADAMGLPRPPRVTRDQARAKLSPAMLSFMNESRRVTNVRMKRELGMRLRFPTVRDGLAAAPGGAQRELFQGLLGS